MPLMPGYTHALGTKCCPFHVLRRILAMLLNMQRILLCVQDVVARGGKFVALYKRPGHRVLLTTAGDLIVRPAAAELSLRQGTSRASLTDHLLSSYQQSFIAVVEGQDGRKEIEGGREGVLHLRELLMVSPHQPLPPQHYGRVWLNQGGAGQTSSS